jgi:prepilin-type N-terminal cleavage/methylation domain-containing protein
MKMISRKGFTLIEVMASLILLAVTLVSLLQLRNDAVARAASSRSGSIASRLGLGLLHRVEAGRVSDLFDGFQGDFAEEGFGDFTYLLGLGDGSAFAGSTGSDAEMTWRDSARAAVEDPEAADLPEYTRIFLTVTWPGSGGEDGSLQMETILPTWGVYQDFELWEALWGTSSPGAIR